MWKEQSSDEYQEMFWNASFVHLFLFFYHVSPEQVNSENSDGEKDVDRVEEQSDDHSCCTGSIRSIEVPVKLGCISYWCVRTVGQMLESRHFEENGKLN